MAEKFEAKLNLVNRSAPVGKQHCFLTSTSEAKARKKAPLASKEADKVLRNEKEALNEARRRALADGAQEPTCQHIRGHLIMTFGIYANSTFKWLIENDVGYIK